MYRLQIKVAQDTKTLLWRVLQSDPRSLGFSTKEHIGDDLINHYYTDES